MTSLFNSTASTIMESAEKLFALKGYHAVSIREISRDAAVNVSAVSYYFGSKQNLLKTMFGERIRSYEIDHDRELSKHIGPVQSLRNFINAMVYHFFLRPYFTNICLQLLLLDSGNSAMDAVHVLDQKNEQWLANIIFKGQNEGFFKSDLTPSMLYSSMKGIITDAISRVSLQPVPGDRFISNQHPMVVRISNDMENFILSLVSKNELG